MKKERPILMSAPMVRAILAEEKTQTRRIVKPQPYFDSRNNLIFGKWNYGQDICGTHALPFKNMLCECPYGTVGDRLWVREAFFEVYDADTFRPTGRYCYAATHEGYVNVLDEAGGIKLNKDGSEASPWKPSIHMPRVASRILLEITGIRVERLQDISEDDALAEGVAFNGDYDLWWDYLRNQWICVDPIDSYESLICKINGKDAWDKNPWVWVVEFKVIEVKGDEHEA